MEENKSSNIVFMGPGITDTKIIDTRPVAIRWYYEMGKMPTLQYAYAEYESGKGSTIKWADVPVQYEPGYAKGL